MDDSSNQLPAVAAPPVKLSDLNSAHINRSIGCLQKHWDAKLSAKEFDKSMMEELTAIYTELGVSTLYAKVRLAGLIHFVPLMSNEVRASLTPKELAFMFLGSLNLMFHPQQKWMFVQSQTKRMLKHRKNRTFSKQMINKCYKTKNFDLVLVFQEDVDKFQELTRAQLEAAKSGLKPTGKAQGDLKVAEQLTGEKMKAAVPNS
jgi:hypothetical protein